MRFLFQSYDPMRMESELQDAKLRENDPQRDRREHTKWILDRIIVVIVCLVLLYLLAR